MGLFGSNFKQPSYACLFIVLHSWNETLKDYDVIAKNIWQCVVLYPSYSVDCVAILGQKVLSPTKILADYEWMQEAQ